MKSYAETVFTPEDRAARFRIEQLAAYLPSRWIKVAKRWTPMSVTMRMSSKAWPEEKPLRCHEVARACSRLLGIEYQDGHYGGVEHTWLWLTPARQTILDVYAVGRLPQVQLVDLSITLPEYSSYRSAAKMRTDIDEELEYELFRWLSYVDGYRTGMNE